MMLKINGLEVVNKLMDFIGSKVAENGGKYVVRFDDVEQMNEIAAYVGLPQCEHGRAYLAAGLSGLNNPANHDDRVVVIVKDAGTVQPTPTPATAAA